MYFGKTRIDLVLTRATVLQTQTIYASETDPNMEIPDILVCTHNATNAYVSPGFSVQRYAAGVNLSPEFVNSSPCSGDFDQLYIISSINQTQNTYSNQFSSSFMKAHFEPSGHFYDVK